MWERRNDTLDECIHWECTLPYSIEFQEEEGTFVAAAWYIVSSSTKGHALSLYHEGEPLTWEELEQDMF